MKCDQLLGEGYTCNNEHDDPSGLCSTHRDMPGPGSSVRGLRRERDRLYDQAASDTIAAGRLRNRIAVLERELADVRRAHATELAHVSMSEREADAARIADLERRLTDSDDAHGRTIEQRDLLEERADELHTALGCEHEASNLHDYFACIRHNALTLQSHYESAERDGEKLLVLNRALLELEDNDYLQCDGPGHAEQPCEVCVCCRARALLPKPAVVHKYRGNTTGFLCGIAPVRDTGTTSSDRKDTTCPACLRCWIDPGVVKAMAGGDSAARMGGDPPETEFEG
jgi:hypothetical protein